MFWKMREAVFSPKGDAMKKREKSIKGKPGCEHEWEPLGTREDQGMDVCGKCYAWRVVNKEVALNYVNEWIKTMDRYILKNSKSNASDYSAYSHLEALEKRKVFILNNS